MQSCAGGVDDLDILEVLLDNVPVVVSVRVRAWESESVREREWKCEGGTNLST